MALGRLKLWALAACAAAAMVAGFAFGVRAQEASGTSGDSGDKWDRGDRGDRHEAWLQKELGLSTAQMGEVKSLHDKNMTAMKDGWTRTKAANDALEKLMSAPEPDRGAIAEQAKVVSELRAQAFEARIDQRLAFQQILTPEQRTKLAAAKSERGRHGRRGHWRHFRRGGEAPSGQPSSAPPQDQQQQQ